MRVEPLPHFSGEKIELLRSNGVIFARRLTDSLGRPLTTHFFDAAGSSYLTIHSQYEPTVAEHPPHASHIRCGDNVKDPLPWKWNKTMKWYWVAASTPGDLNRDNTRDSLRDARVNWENNLDWCGNADNSSMNFTYLGTIASAWGNNGINTVGWGSMSGTGCGSAKACTRTEVGNGEILESDTRFNNQLNWANGSYSGQYDVQTVFSHETGHSIGFDDIGNSTNVMVSWATGTNDASGNLLGKGDSIGNNNKY